MSYCINPLCNARDNPGHLDNCKSCGTPLLINGRFRLIQPLRRLNPYGYTDVFEVVDEIGEGFGGQWVFEPGTRKVMKVLKSREPELIKLMRREARMLQLLDFRGRIPRVFLDDYFIFIPNESNLELHCLVLEKFEGQNLEQWLKENGPISQPRALNWLAQIVRVLDHVHQADFFHRDIKPTNIILKPSGELALIDFGGIRKVTETYLAKISGSENATGVSEALDVTAIMTFGYAPPEQFNAKALPQSDFFALGRTFVHLMTGFHPRNLPTDQQTGNLLWRNRAPQIDEPLANFIDELMAIAPGKRPQNTRIILQRLERLPLQSKWNRIFKSSFFRTGAIGLGLLVTFGVCQGVTLLAANCYFDQGVKAQKANNVELAKRDFEQAAFWNPRMNLPISSFYFDQASRNESNLEFARNNYEMAIKFNPNDIDAYNNLALICQNLNDLVCAKSNYEKALRKNRNYWSGHFNLGTFYDEQGDYKAAEHEYYLAKQPNGKLYVKALNNLSRLKNIQGDYGKAAELAQSGLAELAQESLKRTRDPRKEASLYKNLGWAKLKQKKYSDASRALKAAKELDPGRTDTYCLLAQVESAQHDNANAAKNEDTCLTKNYIQNQPEVRQWREQLLQRLRQK